MIKAILKYGLVLTLALIFAGAKGQQYTEYDLKAAYIFNFSKFVTWPESAYISETSDFNIIVFGDSPVTPVLQKALKNKQVMGRNISIKVIYSVDQITDAHILFVSRDAYSNLNTIISKCDKKSILVVGDIIENFCQSGGIINFTPKSSKYRFEINNQAARNSKLMISSKLLALARIVTSEEIKF